MTRLPRLKGKELIRILENLVSKSYVPAEATFFYGIRMDGRLPFPVHAGEVLGPGLLRSILRDTELSTEDLQRHRT